MPPKRKRVDAEPESTSTSTTRATRSLGQAASVDEPKNTASKSKKSTSKKATTSKAKKASSSGEELEDVPAKPPPKKAKANKSTQEKAKPKPKASKSKSKATAQSDDEPVNEDESGPSTTANSMKDASKPYTPALALSLFSTYADTDSVASEEPAIGPEGFEKLCNDSQIPLEGALPLVLAWMLDAKEMGKIWKNEWVKATGTLQISSLYSLSLAIRDIESLLLLNKPPLKRPSNSTPAKKSVGKIKEKEKDPYNRDQYWDYAADKKSAFLKLYGFCFALAKPAQARNIDMETATAFWSVLLVPQYPIMKDMIEFINEKGSYKGANKDLWSMMLEFCQTVDPSLEDYEADGAWPTLLDDFVAWKKNK